MELHDPSSARSSIVRRLRSALARSTRMDESYTKTYMSCSWSFLPLRGGYYFSRIGASGGRPAWKGVVVIILGVILLILGLVFSISILWTIGIILIVIGAILWILGAAGRQIGPRKYYF
jgi:hypothetical protein